MRKTVIENLSKNILENGMYDEAFYLPIYETFDELDQKELIFSKDTLQVLSLDKLVDALEKIEENNEEHEIKAFLDDLIGVDDTYYLNTLGTLLFSLQDQFERNGFFEEITLLELGQYTLGSFHGLLDAYDRLVHSGHYDKTFLLNLGKTLLTDSYHYLEFVAGLYITSNFEYEEVKAVVSNLDEIIQLALYYDLWEEEMIATLYLWELDDHLFDVFKKFSEEDNFHARAVFFLSFVPLREEVGLFFANNMDVLGYATFYSRYIDINHFSNNLLI